MPNLKYTLRIWITATLTLRDHRSISDERECILFLNKILSSFFKLVIHLLSPFVYKTNFKISSNLSICEGVKALTIFIAECDPAWFKIWIIMT